MVLSQVKGRLSHGRPSQSPVFPRLRTGSLPFCTSHPQARAQQVAQRPSLPRGSRGPACHREHARTPAAVPVQFIHDSCAGRAAGTMFSPSTTAARRRCARYFETCHEVSIAGQQARWRPASPRKRGAGPCGQACCDAPGPRCQTQGDAVSRTPAAGLARLKVQHPGWVIRRRVVPGQATGYTAHRKFSRGGFQSLHTVTLGGLEQALFLAEKGMLDEAGGRRPQPRRYQAR